MREMKDSKVKWLGVIPLEWKVERVKHGFIRKKAEAHQDNPIVLSLARTGVRERDISNNEGQIAESYYNYNPVDVDDLLINPMDLYSGANCSISKISGVISPAYVNLRYREGYNPQYYDYYFKMQYWLMAFFAHGKGVSYENRWTLNAETLMNYPIIVPTECEQRKIVDYLDSKCSKIDEIIEKQRAIIEKLKEYKLSIITEGVTKGLKHNVKMKDSGVRFVDTIPYDWENRKMITILSTRVVDGPHESPELYDTGIPYISATAIVNGKIDFSLMRGYISKEYCEICDKRYSPQRGDLLVVKLGASTGQVAIVDTDERFNIWVPLAAVRCNDEALPKFVYYVFQSDYFVRQMELSWTFGTQQTLGVQTIEKLRILLPPIAEQREIVKFLDTIYDNVGSKIENVEKMIEKLEEYKKSLIYEVVTGKKEV